MEVLFLPLVMNPLDLFKGVRRRLEDWEERLLWEGAREAGWCGLWPQEDLQRVESCTQMEQAMKVIFLPTCAKDLLSR